MADSPGSGLEVEAGLKKRGIARTPFPNKNNKDGSDSDEDNPRSVPGSWQKPRKSSFSGSIARKSLAFATPLAASSIHILGSASKNEDDDNGVTHVTDLKPLKRNLAAEDDAGQKEGGEDSSSSSAAPTTKTLFVEQRGSDNNDDDDEAQPQPCRTLGSWSLKKKDRPNLKSPAELKVRKCEL